LFDDFAAVCPAALNIFLAAPDRAVWCRHQPERSLAHYGRGYVMTSPHRFALAALVFAVLWTIFMVLWSGDYGVVNVVILSVGGLIAGFAWAWAMAWIERRRAARAK
jgi:membrane associated rhomboid family serine protease